MNAPKLEDRTFLRLKLGSLGESGCGKSCLIKRFCEKKFVSKYIPTIGVDFGVRPQQTRATASSPPIEVKVNFFDFSGNEEYADIRSELIDDTQCFLLVCDASDASTFQRIVDRWLPLIDQLELSSVPIAICMNKVCGLIDLEKIHFAFAVVFFGGFAESVLTFHHAERSSQVIESLSC